MTVNINALNWSIYRNVGDYIHFLGIAVLLWTVFIKKNLTGLSFKTQLIYLMIYCCRYLDIFLVHQRVYVVVCKCVFILTAAMICLGSYYLKNLKENSTYEIYNDTVLLRSILIPCFIMAVLFSHTTDVVDILWAFSEYLEGFSMIPQYVFVYRENGKQSKKSPGLWFMMLFGLYRCFYAMHWVYKKYHVPSYRDYQSWTAGAIEILFFFDFLMFQFDLLLKRSLLRDLVLSVDDKVIEVNETIEVKIMGVERAEKIQQHKTEMTELRMRRSIKRQYSSDRVSMVRMQDGL